MRHRLPLALASTLLLAVAAGAAERQYLLRDEPLCDGSGDFCLRGSLWYEPNPRLLQLHGRVEKAPGPGLLRITLRGSNRLGHRRYTVVELRLRGAYSEIIDHKMIPDPPDAEHWTVSRVDYRLATGNDAENGAL